MPTGRQPANIPNQRCGADVGSLAVHGEEEVTSSPFTSYFGPPSAATVQRELSVGRATYLFVGDPVCLGRVEKLIHPPVEVVTRHIVAQLCHPAFALTIVHR